jgi:ubiquinone biosynthesis protein
MASLVTAVRDMERLRQITAVLVRHGFGELVRRLGLGGTKDASGTPEKRPTLAVRLRLVLQDLGPSFIKLGQIVSTRPDLIPADVITELKKLQDDVPRVPTADIKQVIEETLGAPIAEVFADFTDEPLACASIGQVHRARLPAGEEVVVKVQRPKIREVIERDLDLLYFLARLLERAVPETRIYSPTGMVAEFDRAIIAELDFGHEADNAERFAQNFQGNPRVHFPVVHRAASGKRVLTLEFLAGQKIHAAVAAGSSAEKIAKGSLAIIAQMIFEDGLFHADPHPGNILILGPPDDPIIGILDLGLVGRLTPELRDKAIDLMVAAVRAETDAIADALLAIGRPRGKVDLPAFRAEVARLAERYLGKSLANLEFAALLRDLIQGAMKYEIELPPEFLMVGKALMTVEGVGREIYPELDVFTELRPYFLRLLWLRYHPERLGRNLLSLVGQISTAAGSLPRQLHTILEDLQSGRLEIRASDPQLPVAADRLGRRIYASILCAALVLGGVWLLAAGRQELLGWVLVSIAGLQLFLHLAGDLRRKR